MENKNNIQNYETVAKSDMLSVARSLKADGYRFVQLCGITEKDGTTLLYSFDKDLVLYNKKVKVLNGEEIESITGEYWNAFVYENEVSDLFGVKFNHSELDFGGNFFKVAEATPWQNK